MGEIRLTCPECRTEYRLPEGAIPETGREVECTACGNIWWASRNAPASQPVLAPQPMPPAAVTAQEPALTVVRHDPDSENSATPPATDADHHAVIPGDIAPLSRRLPENVLSILREEVEHERRARAIEASSDTAPTATAATADSDPEWPATTITETRPQTADRIAPALVPIPAPEAPAASPAPVPIPVPRAPAAPPPAATETAPAPRPEPTAITPPAQTAQPPAPAGRQAYLAGFGLAAMIAALALAFYLLAPGMAGTGAVGDRLMQFRQHVDAGRLWLDQQIGQTTGQD